MDSFSSLYCPPDFLIMYGNPNMTSLNGLNNVQPAAGGGPLFNASMSGPFTNTSSAAIKQMAGCTATGTSPLSAPFLLPVTPCGPLQSYSEFCAFAVLGVCPPGRPSPYASDASLPQTHISLLFTWCRFP